MYLEIGQKVKVKAVWDKAKKGRVVEISKDTANHYVKVVWEYNCTSKIKKTLPFLESYAISGRSTFDLPLVATWFDVTEEPMAEFTDKEKFYPCCYNKNLYLDLSE